MYYYFVNAISRYSLYPNRSSGGSESHEIEDAAMGSELKKKQRIIIKQVEI